MSANDLAGLEAFFSGTSIEQKTVSTTGAAHRLDPLPPNDNIWAAWEGSVAPSANPGHEVPKVITKDDEDDFGDFEDGTMPSQTATSLPQIRGQQSQVAAAVRQHQLPPAASASAAGACGATSLENEVEHYVPRAHKPKRTDDVLFDADDEPEDDTFGEFEYAEPSGSKPELSVKLAPIDQPKQIVNAPSKRDVVNLLDMNDPYMSGSSSTTDVQQPSRASKSRSKYDIQSSNTNQVRQRSTISETAQSQLNQQAPTQPELEASWDDFEEWALPEHASTRREEGEWQYALELPSLLKAFPNNAQPPTNIPPPIIVISAFPRIFDVFRSALLDPLSKIQHSDPSRDAVLADARVQSFVLEFCSIVEALGHILAGRKLRWKRDMILAQSMRIGQASGRNSGMKLASLDRSEHAKEDREAEDIIALWKTLAGRMKTVITAMALSNVVSDLSESMPVRTALQHEGALSAPKVCIICGIKRNERVHKVDVDVDDSFGEWWIDYWGHKSCARFWISYSDDLRGR